MLNLTMQELLQLLSLCSKAALLDPKKIDWDHRIERAQFNSAVIEAVPILGKLDLENPGLMAIPHDGRTWKERAGLTDKE